MSRLQAEGARLQAALLRQDRPLCDANAPSLNEGDVCSVRGQFWSCTRDRCKECDLTARPPARQVLYLERSGEVLHGAAITM